MKLVETYKNSSEWVIDCCFTPSEQIFGYILVRTSNVSIRWSCCLLCTNRSKYLFGFLRCLVAHWNNSLWIDMSPLLWHIILIPRQPVFVLPSSYCVLSRKEGNTYFIVIGLIWPGLEPKILHTTKAVNKQNLG